MSKYRKKPVEVEATQWFKDGDHPKVVKILNGLIYDNFTLNNHCDKDGKEHGWIDTLEGGHVVCPSDWIVTDAEGNYSVVKNDIFKATYERVEE